MVDMYNILHKYAVDTSSPEYKAPLNTIYNTGRLMTPEDTAIVAQPGHPILLCVAGFTRRADCRERPAF